MENIGLVSRPLVRHREVSQLNDTQHTAVMY